MTNWTARDLAIDFSFLKDGAYEAVVFSDGVNADREATDYKKTIVPVSAREKLKVHLALGGGWAAIISKK
jgi:alpha-glucosidase